MASIQESMNQLLYTATIGAGLYARSPQGQQKAKVKNLEKAIEANKQEQDVLSAVAAQAPSPDPAIKRDIKSFEKETDLYKQLYEETHSEEALGSYLKSLYEARELGSKYKDRVLYLKNQKDIKAAGGALGIEIGYTKSKQKAAPVKPAQTQQKEEKNNG